MARVFTLGEANRLVPRLENLFDRLNRLRASAQPIQASMTHVEQYGYSNGVDQATKLRELRGQLDAKLNELKVVFEEITALGCEVKDAEVGLVDFPAERDGRVVYLCWRRGEDQIRYWHELDAGFAGRQPL
ncbi:MAG TPA: DUF2203 domain-containing protein [Chloroflexota bacterium]|nr:DUF2203 domain-containing protein [Chloroflexota bacterium]HUX87358.1 DUF2203 domain-containing protein [Chloroflexota bacterium]HVB97342.1 DUF2203 domain-containing protein [Chloroflexota bacterium]